MKKTIKHLSLVGMFLVSSCATLNEQQCKTGNWEEIGRSDGANGLPASRVASHTKACREHGVLVNNAQYQKGYDVGVRSYCTTENAYQMGKSGRMFSQATCPADLAAAFTASLSKGYAEYQREVAAREQERKVRELAAAKLAYFNLNPRAGICDASVSGGFCIAFSGEKFLNPETLRGSQMMCRFLGGQYQPFGNCPQPNVLGRCDLVKGTPDSYSLFYYQTQHVNSGVATKDCADPKSSLHSIGAGQWVGVPG